MYFRHARALVFISFVLVSSHVFAQTFSPAKLSPLTGSSDFATGDFNNDGFLDIVTVNGSTNQVELLLGNGDGTFSPGGSQQIVGASKLGRVVIGDFNGDGNLDVAVLDTGASGGGTAIYLLFGDGKGMLAPPSGNYSAPAIPNSIAAGDFNNDGTTDLAVLSQSADFSSAVVTLLINNGDGTFTSSSFTDLPHAFMTQFPGFKDSLSELVAGDFDADGRMDLVLRDGCVGCDVDQEKLFLLKNIPSPSGGSFAAPQPFGSFSGSFRLRVFDVDGDGRADIVAAFSGCHTPCEGISIIFANADGTVSGGGVLVSGVGTFPKDVVVGDFNNDGIMDLAAPVSAGLSAGQQIPNGIAIWTGKGGRIGFNDPVYFPLADNAHPFAIAAGFIDADNNKDILTLNGDGTIAAFLNTTSSAGDPCPYPDQPGVNFCLPANGSTTVHPTRIVASARGAIQPVNRIEVWVDGDKQFQTFNDKLDTTLRLTQAQHTVAIVEVDATGAFLKAEHSFTVGSGTANQCTSPDSPGVHVCAPQPGGTYDSPVRFVATGAGASGSVERMELRIDGQKLLEAPGDQIDTSVVLTAGFHEAIIVEVDSSGASIESSPVDFGVNGPQGTCPVPVTFPSVHFCEPVDQGTYDNPLVTKVSANVPQLTLLRIYLNDQVAAETTNSALTISTFTFPQEVRLVAVAYDANGNSYVDRRTVTATGQPQGGCAATLFPSAHICTPANGSTTPTPVRVRAATAISSLQLFRLYVDDQPVFEISSSSIDTNLDLAAGPHHLVVVAYNGDGQVFTDSVSTTVSGILQNCPVPDTDRTITICSPEAGSTVPSPVNITARGRWDHFPIVHMRVYVDDQPAFDVDNPQDAYFNTQVALPSGTHTLVIVAWNQQGEAITSSPQMVTVP